MVRDRCDLLISPYPDLPPSEMLRLKRSWNFRALSNLVISPPTTCLVFRFFLKCFGFLVLRSNAMSPPPPFTICLLHLHRIVPHTSFSHHLRYALLFFSVPLRFAWISHPSRLDHLSSDLPCCPAVFVPARRIELLLYLYHTTLDSLTLRLLMYLNPYFVVLTN